MIVVITKIGRYLGALLLLITYSVNMNHARRTFGFSAVLSLALVIGATQGAVGATYPPVPGTGLPTVPTTIVVPVPPLVPGSIVEIPKAPGSKVVFTLILVLPTVTNLKNLLSQARPRAVRVTPGLIIGGITRGDSRVPKVIVNTKLNAPVEIQTKVNVPLSISLRGFKPRQTEKLIVIQGTKRVVVGTFKVPANGVFILPAVTLVGTSTVKFSLQGKAGSETIVLRPVVSKSKFSTAKIKVG